MEFWGVEVKNGKPCSVDLEGNRVVHLSQACLVEGKDSGSKPIYLYVTIDGKKIVLGTLSYPEFPQQQFDLVFDKSFKLSHSWKNGTVNFLGYGTYQIGESDSSDYGSDSEFGEYVHVPSTHEANEKPATQGAKQKVNLAGPGKDVEEKGDTSDDTDSSDDSDEDDTSDTNSSEDEVKESKAKESPKKVEKVSKRKPAESASETPGKKAKFVTPKKTGADNKKNNVHVDTPYPSKQAGKTSTDQSNKQKPSESAGSHACGPCNRSFKSEQALESHSKAKHSNEKSK